MKRRERIESLKRRLRAEPREWRVDELAGMYGVSPLTMRRDLEALAKQRVIIRTHGGCISADRAAGSAYYRRISANFGLKSSIGRLAAGQVRPGQTILINDGSTCFHLASSLGGCEPLTVYTNSIAMIPELARHGGVRISVLGGGYERELFCLVGSMMERMLEMLEFDIVFLGTDGIDAGGRCLAGDADVARVTEVMMRRGRRRILLADHTKLNAGGSVAYATLADFDAWITTPGLPEERRLEFDSMTTVMEAQPCRTE